MERNVSPLGSFFSVVGIAVTALADGQGKNIDRWSGFDGKENLRKKLTKLMGLARDLPIGSARHETLNYQFQ